MIKVIEMTNDQHHIPGYLVTDAEDDILTAMELARAVFMVESYGMKAEIVPLRSGAGGYAVLAVKE